MKYHHTTFLSALLLTLSTGVTANPAGEQVISGQAEFERNGSNLIITQGTQRVIINWQDFSNANGELTKFIQPNSSSAALNRVVSGNLSSLLGDLQANGKIYLINPNGIVIGADANINTQSFIASTLSVSNAEFINGGDMNFVGSSTTSVTNLGSIDADGGDVFLIAKHVDNLGVIKADDHVGLAGGNDVLLKASGDDRLAVRVTNKDGRVDQTGLIEAATIELRTAGNNPYALAINHTGISRATSAVNKNGRIILFAENGTTHVDGTLDASAPENGDGGFIETSGMHVKIAETVKIDTSSANGEIGTWLIDPNNFTIAATGGDITGTTLATQLNNNNVTIETATQGTPGNGDIFVNDNTSWASGNSLTLNAERDITISNTITNTGAGDINLNAGNGANGAAPSANGTIGLRGGNVMVNAAVSTAGDINIKAGNGGAGGRGADAGNVANASGGNGGHAGNGGKVAINGQLTATAGSVSVTAGHGGIGGSGGRGSTGSIVDEIINIGSLIPSGSAGGAGGNGSFGGDVQVSQAISSGQNTTLIAGNGGQGGSSGIRGGFGQSVSGRLAGAGGNGGHMIINASIGTGTAGNLTARAGHGGNGGVGGTANSAVFKHAVNTSLGVFLTSANGGDGGRGGDGGLGGNLTTTVDLQSGGVLTLSAGNGGGGGRGGFASDGGSNGAFGTGPSSPAGSGGDGGNGGDGGGGVIATLKLTAEGDITVSAGHAGSGGNGTRGGRGNSYANGGDGGNGGFGGFAGGGRVTVGGVDSINGKAMLTAGNGGHGGEAGSGGDGGNSGSSIQAGGQGGRGGHAGSGGGGDVVVSNISANGVKVNSAGGGGGRAGGIGGLSKLVGFATERAVSGISGAFGSGGDIVAAGNIATTDQDIVLNAARDLVLQNGANLAATGAGNIIGAATGNFHNDSGSSTPISLNGGRWLVYSTRPDVNRNDLEMNNDFVRYGTNFNAGDPNPISFPTGNGLIYKVTASADATINNQTIVYGQTIDKSNFTLSNFLLDGNASSAIALGINSATAIEASLDNSVGLSGTGFANAGGFTDGLIANNFSNLTLNLNKGDLTVNQKPLTITANDDSNVFDGLNYSGGNGLTFIGFITSEDTNVLGGTLAFSGDSQGAVNPGSYTITPQGLTSNNYNIAFVDGGLTISQASVGGGEGSPGNTFTDFQAGTNNDVNPPNTGSNNNGFNNNSGNGFNFGGSNRGGGQGKGSGSFSGNDTGGSPASFSHSSSFDDDEDKG